MGRGAERRALLRRIERLSEKRGLAQRSSLLEASRLLAGLCGDERLAGRIARRIAPRSELEAEMVESLASLLRDTPRRLRSPLVFAEDILGLRPTSYQRRVLEDESRQVAVLGCRQSGKTIAVCAKIAPRAATSPMLRVAITAPTFRQSRKTFRRLRELILGMNQVARRALVAQELRTVIRFINGSEVEAYPYAPQRLRGETIDMAYIDEADFIPDEEEFLEATLKPMLATRWERGAIIMSSTPGRVGSYFQRVCSGAISGWSVHKWTWREAVEEGVIKRDFIEHERASKPEEFLRREYECEWVEERDSWLSIDLVACCLDPSEGWWGFEESVSGRELYAGLDLGKKVDHSVLSVVERLGDDLYLRHVKIWPLETSYSSVVGYLKVLSERWRTMQRVVVDVSGVGEAVAEQIGAAGVPGYEGLVFTAGVKEELATYLKQVVQDGCRMDSSGKWVGESRLHVPYPSDTGLSREVVSQLNVERFEYTGAGRLRLYHPEGTRDDVFWSIAMAVWASRRPGARGGVSALSG